MEREYRLNVNAMLRSVINDPPGNSVGEALRQLGFDVRDVRMGTHIEVNLAGENAREQAEEIAGLDSRSMEAAFKVLGSSVINDYFIETEQLGPQE